MPSPDPDVRSPHPDFAAEPDVADLVSRLGRYPADRYPAQHATAAFHLGTLHLQRERVPQAREFLAVAQEVFGRVGMRLEQAKATLMGGIAMRQAGQPACAVALLTEAGQAFSQLDQAAEEAAASYNLGLVLGENGNGAEARETLARAKILFLRAGHPAQAGSAARELGASLLTAGEPDAATAQLVEALELATQAGDGVGAGSAANVLGLAHLAAGNAEVAVGAFRDAAGMHPRSVRPAEHAMAKANLALALERAGESDRARLAALQARAVPGADVTVVAQCERLLQELRGTGDELFSVLEREPQERWQAVVRDEVLRWVDSDPVVGEAESSAWVRGLLARPGAAPALGEALLGVLVELPPPAYLDVVGLVVRATSRCEEQDAERFRAITRSTMARFPLPQFQRMAGTFDRVAAEAGEPTRWS